MTMQWSSEQIDQIKSAVAEGRRRVSVQLTDVQRQLWRQEVATEDAGRGETVARVSRIRAAAMRPGVFGDLRRAIERLAATLGLRLMHEIPRTAGA